MKPSASVTSHASVVRSAAERGEQFRAIAELSGDVAWIIDFPAAQPGYISPSVEHLLGYGLAEFQQQLNDNDPRGPLNVLCAGLAERLRRFAEGDRSRMRLVREFELRHRDGRIVPVEITSTLLLDAGGVPSALVGVVRDLTPRREHEDAQRRFARMLNHEFRTPLSTIDGAIQRLEVTGARADHATRQRYRKIGNAVDRLIGMLDQYLSPDRMQSIGRARQPDAIDPRQLLEEGAAMARAAGRAVTLEAGELPAAIRCEPQGLRLALKVLVENALQYSAPGSPITLSGRRAAGGIELVVQDRGAGVPAHEREQIFAKSYRGSNAGERPGSGLGLYMARSVVEVHGGSVELSNTAPDGARFKIWLPAQGGAGKEVASGGSSSDNSLHQQGMAPGRQTPAIDEQDNVANP